MSVRLPSTLDAVPPDTAGVQFAAEPAAAGGSVAAESQPAGGGHSAADGLPADAGLAIVAIPDVATSLRDVALGRSLTLSIEAAAAAAVGPSAAGAGPPDAARAGAAAGSSAAAHAVDCACLGLSQDTSVATLAVADLQQSGCEKSVPKADQSRGSIERHSCTHYMHADHRQTEGLNAAAAIRRRFQFSF